MKSLRTIFKNICPVTDVYFKKLLDCSHIFRYISHKDPYYPINGISPEPIMDYLSPRCMSLLLEKGRQPCNYGRGKNIMALFLSTYVNKVDKKGRVSVPALFRSILAKQEFTGIVAYFSFLRECIEASGLDHIEKLYEKIENLDPFSEERDAFTTSILGGSVQLSLDSDGRVSLPKDLTEAAGIKEQVVFVGKGSTFEIWSPEKFDIYAAEARRQAKEKRASLTLLGQGGSGK